jgi:hypothetical protein
MADSTSEQELIELEYDRIVTKPKGKVTTLETIFLLLYQIQENTA